MDLTALTEADSLSVTALLHMLEPKKVLAEMAYSAIAVGKTAGRRERAARGWIQDEMVAVLDDDARTLGTAC